MMDEHGINLQLIIEGCRRGNAQSQRKLYKYFFGYGMSICLRYSRNDRQAEEILNDGFLKVFRKIDRYDPDYPFKYWLRQILIHAAIDYFRRNRSYYRFFSGISDLLPETPVPPEYPRLQEGEPVLPVVQRLPPAYRLVFNLYVMEGLKHHEIAERLGISVGSSKSNLARAKAKLRKWLADSRTSPDKHKRHG